MFKTVVLDNDMEYLIMDTANVDTTTYVLLSNVNNDMDFCFRKITIREDGEQYFSGLADRKEYEKVLLLFAEKLNN